LKLKNIRIILYQPLFEINIGYVARNMKNFGLSELYIVSPLARLGRTAQVYSVHADDILKKAVIVERLEDALAGVDYIVGTTGKKGGIKNILRQAITPEELALKLLSLDDCKVAIIFGREDIGLTNDILALCDIIVTIPANPEYPILNLSHAATIIFYEIFKFIYYESTLPMRKGRLIAIRENNIGLSRFYSFIDDILDHLKLAVSKRQKTKLAIKRILGRSLINMYELQTILGLARQIREKIACEETGRCSRKSYIAT